ncbi:MAG TPA: type I restriction-modification enzyme R subunit C-terminal domain-containing protein [Clostridia bacterium]|nr:type I restriction-modification enzyme R subunit C-terminal domain-containing protein [Clostridia bacterium]
MSLFLDREAAKQALAGFLTGKTRTANQTEFVNLIISHLTEHGVMDDSVLNKSPFQQGSFSLPSDVTFPKKLRLGQPMSKCPY